MPALSYKGRFVDYVEAGLKPNPPKGRRIKRQTIRNFRKHPIKVGDTLYHYYGLRTRFCRKLGESICKEASTINIFTHMVQISTPTSVHSITSTRLLNAFAYADGFANWEEMKRWWTLTHGPECFPFVGQLIKW